MSGTGFERQELAMHRFEMARVLTKLDRWLTEVPASHLGGQHTEYRAKMAAILGRKEDAIRLMQQASSEGYPFGTERHQAPEYQALKGYAPFDAFMRPKG